jgi:hypothetical protein
MLLNCDSSIVIAQKVALFGALWCAEPRLSGAQVVPKLAYA